MNEEELKHMAIHLASETNQLNGSPHTAETLVEAAKVIYNYLNGK